MDDHYRPSDESLTAREREILTLIVQNLSYAEISQRLHIENTTIKWYVQEIYDKLHLEKGQRNHRHLLERVQALGLLPITADDRPQVPVADKKRSASPLQFSRIMWGIFSLILLISGMAVGVRLLGGELDSRQTADVYNREGLDALAQLNYDRAIGSFDQAIDVDPTNAAAHYNRGVAYEELGDFETARMAYETALAQDTQLLMARYRLAALLLDAGEWEDGFQIIDAGVRILKQGQIDIEDSARDRATFLLLATRGRAYLLRGEETNLSLAEIDLRQALIVKDSVPYPASVYYHLALIYEAQGQADTALQAWYDTLATYDPNSPYQREWAAQARVAIESLE